MISLDSAVLSNIFIIIIGASFCCTKNIKNLRLLLTKVANLQLFLTKVVKLHERI